MDVPSCTSIHLACIAACRPERTYYMKFRAIPLALLAIGFSLLGGTVMLHAQEQPKPPNSIGYGYTLNGDLTGASAWWCESAWKVDPIGGTPADNSRPTIALEAARGEFEPVQIVLAAKSAGLSINKVVVSDLRGKRSRIPASAILLFEVATVNIVNPTDYLGHAGEYPDPLPPLKTPLVVPAGRSQSIWVLVRVPERIAAGDYSGKIEIVTDKGTLSAPLTVTVFDFTLPRESHLRSGFGFYPANMEKYHHVKTQADKEKVFAEYMKSFGEHRIAPYSFYEYAPIKVSVVGKGDQQKVKVDFRAFDKAAKTYMDKYHFNAFVLPLEALGGGTFYERRIGKIGEYSAGSPEYERLVADYFGQIQNHLVTKGWIDKAYIYWFDEPDTKDYPFVAEVMDRIKKYAPKLKRMLTKQPSPDLMGKVDLWCALSPEWTPEKVAERKAAGEEVWWYICCAPQAPYISEFIEHPATEMRLWPWQSWQYGVQGILIWSTNWWTSANAFPDSLQDPWADPASYVEGYGTPIGKKQSWGNGDGRYLYPPRVDPNKPHDPIFASAISSVRWENLRDGMEDYEYFYMLKQQVDRVRGKADAAVVVEAEGLLVVPTNISENTVKFTTDPRPMMEHRGKIAKMIERLRKITF